MPELTDALFQVMKRVDGFKFNGHLTSSSSVNTKEKAPYRVLHARRPSFLVAGDTIITRGGEVVILMDHPDEFDWAVSYKAVYALNKLSWMRTTKIIDPVSKAEKNGPVVNLGTLYVNFDSAEELSIFGFADTGYRFITGQNVLVGDKVGEYTVKRVVESLGVKLVYVA